MKKLMRLLWGPLIFLSILNPIFAEFKVSQEMLNSSLSQVSLSKDQIKMMVDVMVAQGQVTPQMGEKTKGEIDKLTESELQAVIKQALTHIQKNGTDSMKGMGFEDALKSLGK